MMKILSIFPGFVGAICIIILLGSIIGFSHQEKIYDIPIVPCSDDADIGCRIGMTSSDINVPNAFKLLQIEVDVNWGEPDRSWFGVINKYPEACEPDSNGLTNCTEGDFEGLIIAGGSDSEGNLKFDMHPNKYRFITGGKDGATISNQDVTLDIKVSLNSIIEILLAAVGLFLFIGATEMAFPIKKWFEKFRNT